MSSIKTIFSDLNKTVSATVQKNHLKNDDSSFARISRNTANAENLIAVITRTSSTKIDEGYLYYCARLFKEAILEKLKEGTAVNIFDMGTLYLTANGNIEGTNPSLSGIPTISVGFTPSDEAKHAVSTVKISSAIIADNSPVLNTFTDLYTNTTGFTVTAGKCLQINGARLKVAGDGSGIFFAKENGNGEYSADESTWISVPRLSKNKPSEVSFFLPESLAAGEKYFIILRTAASHGTKVNKTLRTGVSKTALEIV